MPSLALLAAALAAVAYGTSSVLQSIGARRVAAGNHRLRRVGRQLPYLAGLGCDGAGWVLSLAALRALPLFVVQATLASSLAVTVLVDRAVSTIALERTARMCVLVVVAALAVLGIAADDGAARQLSSTGQAILLAAAAPVALTAYLAARRGAATATGALAGLAFGGTAIAERALDLRGPVIRLLVDPVAIAVVVFGAIGIVTYAAALTRGAVGGVTAALWVAETIVPGAVGLLVLGDRVRPGWAVGAVVAFAAAITAVVVLARSLASRSTEEKRVTTTIDGIGGLKAHVGQHLGYSDWVTVTQEQVDRFADATGDHQWIHIDPERAKAGPFGGPIAHGYLTLSLAPMLLEQVIRVSGISMGVNYGLNKLRFPSPVPVGSRLRLGGTLTEAEEIAGGAQVTIDMTFEVEGQPKPACVASGVFRYYA